MSIYNDNIYQYRCVINVGKLSNRIKPREIRSGIGHGTEPIIAECEKARITEGYSEDFKITEIVQLSKVRWMRIPN